MTALANEARAILDISGSQARQLLHGQCSADVQSLRPGTWTLGALATHQGRLYGNFYCLCLNDEQFWLILPQRQLENVLQRLQKYAAFFKATLIELTNQWEMTPPVQLGAGATPSVEVSPAQVSLTVPAAGLAIRWTKNDHAAPASADVLTTLAQAEIAAGIAWVTPELNEQYLPQSLAWDTLGGVSFRKGCYTGQEVIARLHYKGATKRRLTRVTGTGSAPAPGTRVVEADRNKPIGEVVRAISAGPGWQGLAVLKWPSDEVAMPALSVDEQPLEVGLPVG